ncbi:hypothetical protein CANARDRAFT_200974 [[Candida] arabinofermentans NRRL YB-2248]|uniref:ABC transporter domain-containing protein n=1 Tax=[Candida] arabinofermentans NRRL YB-2248 TaxID=983967 RepID=A0A1E4SY09_9ASCO|nr:hypothetical protein CANARDRAFT_200974 [[Candida] arabinofermentans NRRL YB-2248]
MATWQKAGFTVNKYLAIAARTVNKSLKPEFKVSAEKRGFTEVKVQQIEKGSVSSTSEFQTVKSQPSNLIEDSSSQRPQKKTWKERWFGLTGEQQQQAGFGEVIRLLKLARKDIKLFGVAVVLLFISASIVMSLPKITGAILDATRHYPDLQSIELYGFSLNTFLGIMAGLLCLSTICTFGRIIILRVLGEKLVARLRSSIMKKTLRQDMEFYDTNKVGDLISRLSSDAYVVSRSVTQNMSDGIKHAIVGGSSITMMFLLSMKLSLVLLAFGPPLVFASYIYGMKIRAISRELQQATGSLTKVAEEQLNSIKTIQSFTAETKELRRYDDQIRDVFKISYKDALTNATFFASTGVLGNVTFLITLGFGTHLVMNGMMSVGDLTAYLIYTEYCGSATFGVANFYTDLFKGAGAASRLFELIDKEPTIEQVRGAKITSSRGHIKFDKVSFYYPTRPNNKVFDEISFEIKPGSNVCIVGPSGRGKSTIASLLLRFYNPTSGTIYIDGEDISKYSVHSLRSLVGFVQQEPVLMPGTLADNIKYGLPSNTKVTSDMIEWAAAKADCDFINSFPEKFNTNIGPRGSLLSGGQKQKIAIARCLIKNPPILILDEATSALDSKSESAINLTLANLLRDKSITTISIAHRLSTIEKCDEILVLGYDGKLVEQGKFRELYADENSRLYKLLNESEMKKKENSHEQHLDIENEATEDLKGSRTPEESVEDHDSLLTKTKMKQKLIEENETLSQELSDERQLLNDNFLKHKVVMPDHFEHQDDMIIQKLKETNETSRKQHEDQVEDQVEDQEPATHNSPPAQTSKEQKKIVVE